MKSEELRRSNRYTEFLPITVTARANNNKQLVAGPLSARIVNVSSHGACLLLTKVMIQSYHFFHSTREDESVELVLHITLPSHPEPIEIISKPVWLNASKLNDIKGFKMGVDFTSKIDNRLMQTINTQINTT